MKLAPLAPQGFGGQPGQVVALEQDAARRGFRQPEQGAAQGGFAAARLAHQSNRLAGVEREADIINGFEVGLGLEPTRAAREVNGEVLDLEKGWSDDFFSRQTTICSPVPFPQTSSATIIRGPAFRVGISSYGGIRSFIRRSIPCP